jgi:hypothetical protein
MLSSGLKFGQPFVAEKEKQYNAVKCFQTDCEGPVILPPPCMLPECLSSRIRVVNVERECDCIDPPPIPICGDLVEVSMPGIEYAGEPISEPATCVNRAYMNGNWMSHLWSYINIDSIDHNQAPYNNYSVSFQYQVLPDGTVTNLSIDGDAFGAEKMLRKAFEESKLKWAPAIVDGQPVPSTFQQKIVFYPDNNTPVSIEEPKLLRFDSWL